MTGDRFQHIYRKLAAADPTPVGTTRLCALCAEMVAMTGAGIMLMAGHRPQGSVCSTNDVSALIEGLQYTLGEGPCVDAYQQHRPVLEPDLANPATPRWLAFTPPALDAGARAVFGFPLEVGGSRIGALNLYRDQPGPLTADQHADAVAMAGVAARVIIGVQAEAPVGTLAAELERSGDFQFVVHQAAGMVAVQLDVPVQEAHLRLRAHAFRIGQVVGDVARAVVDRRLRFDQLDKGAHDKP